MIISAMDMQSFASLGGIGLLAFIMWKFAERFIDALQLQVEARIQALEKRCSDCETDRINLHAKLEAILERNARIDVARETIQGMQPPHVVHPTRQL